MPRCTRRDEGKMGCVREDYHRGVCAVRSDAARVYAAGGYRPRHRPPPAGDFPCVTAGCQRRVKHEGSRCPSCRVRLRYTGRGRTLPSGGPSPAALSGAPSPALASGIVPGHGPAAMSASQVIANLAARAALAGLARAIQRMLGEGTA